MDKKFIDLAPKYFLNGYSCSESIAAAAVELGLAKEDLISAATSFSGGISSGCLCGAVSGSMMVLGILHGKLKDNSARKLAKEFYDEFIAIHKAACCRVLTKEFKDFHSKERKAHCVNMVESCAKILDKMLAENKITA